MTIHRLDLDHSRSVVMAGRVEHLNAAVGWYVHGDDSRGLHCVNLMSDEELALAAVVGERVASAAAQVLGARRAVGDEVGVVVVGAGAGRGGP
jgi:hypothetical protein